jgi:hypothetical protein
MPPFRAFLAKARLEPALPADKQCLLIVNQIQVNPTTSLKPRTIYLAIFSGDQLIVALSCGDGCQNVEKACSQARTGMRLSFERFRDAEGTSTSA